MKAGQKRKNEDKTESTPKRRRYASPPPPSSSNPAPIYLLKRNLSDKERSNELTLSPQIPMKFALTNHTVVNFGRDPKNELCLTSNRKVLYRKKLFPNDFLISRNHGQFIFDAGRGWSVVDKDSTNGIIVNETKIAPNKKHPLAIDDEIIIGKPLKDTEFKYVFVMKTGTIHHPPPTPRTPHTSVTTTQGQTPSPLRETPRFDSQNSQHSMSFDASQLQNMIQTMQTMTKDVLNQQQKQFEEAMKKKAAETEALRDKLNEQQLAEIAAKEEENQKKAREIAEKEAELKQNQEDVLRKQKEKEKEIEMEKSKNAQQIAAQQAELLKKQEIESKKSREREEAAAKKLAELTKQQRDIEARDRKQRERNEIEHQKWIEKQQKLEHEKKKMEQKEREINEKEAKVKQQKDDRQQNMEEECTCCICCDLLVASRSLQCGHTSCHQCLEAWMKEQKTCPSCRNPIKQAPVPCFVVDNLIVDTYLKDKSAEEREEYMERKREYEVWKREKKEAEEAKKRQNNNNAALRARQGGNHAIWAHNHLNNAPVRSIDRNNRNNNNNNVVPLPFHVPIPLQPRGHQVIVNNGNNRINRGNRMLFQPQQRQVRPMPVPLPPPPPPPVIRANRVRNNNNNNRFYRHRRM